MQNMWSPWRSVHLERATADKESAEREGRSLFVQLAAEDNDEDNLILWRGEHVFVIMNRYPYNNGHLMVVPFREVADYEALTPKEQIAIARTIEHAIRWLKQVLNPEGFNVGMNLGQAAGAGIPRHLHVHIVPRWSGDTNFMPTIGEVKVIPEALQTTYAKLRATIEAVAENAANI